MKKYICNPLNLEYRLQIKKEMGTETVFREAADPTMIVYKGTYYLFVSMSGGFWYSDDLYHWDFHETPELPIYDYAPDVSEINGKMVFSASKGDEPCSFFVSDNPLIKPFEPIATLFPFWDPALFQDDDGRVYFYWGCGNTDPLYGMELDRDTLLPIGEKVALFGADEHNHGWERYMPENKVHEEPAGTDAAGTDRPFFEGAYMNKHNNKYYLQYAAPGTEFNVYSDGVYLSDKPLGLFTYQKHNPFSSKPGGFITAAGHGSTFQDRFDNWWHIATMRISVNDMFERRLGLFPCAIDKNGTLYCNQHFADYPFALPEGERTDMSRMAPEWNLISYGAKCDASSFQPGFEPAKGIEEDIQTWWAAKDTDKDPWYSIYLGGLYEVYGVQVNFAEHQLKKPAESVPIKNETEDEAETSADEFNDTVRVILAPGQTDFLLEGSIDGSTWENLHQGTGDFTHVFVHLSEPVKLRFVRLQKIKLAASGVAAVSGLRVFGKANGSLPKAVASINAVRSENGMDVQLSWEAVAGADGYNVRYGNTPETLYNSWQVWGANELRLPFLNRGEKYCIAVDSYNKNGVTEGKIITI